MNGTSSLPKYYANPRDTWKQLPAILPIVAMFVVTLLYASGLKNPAARTLMFYLSLGYPAVIVFSLSFSIRRLNYHQIDSHGIYTTIMGFIHRRIDWSDIEGIGPAAIGNVKGIGLTYISSFTGRTWGRAARRKMFGWDEMLANAHTKDGKSLADQVEKHFKKHLGLTS